MRQRAGGGKLNRGHNFHRLSRGPSVQHHSNCLNASPSCCQAGCLVMVSAFCVQHKGFLALHHLSMHRLHPECNSSDFLQQLHTWGNCVKNVHLLHTRKLKALIWNGTTKVTNPAVISTQIRDQQTQTGTLLSAVDFLRLQQHHRLFKRIKSRRSAWSLATRWYKTVNYSCRFHKSAFVSESLHSENQGYNLTKQCSSQWQLVVVRQRQEPTKAAGENRLLASKHGCEQCRIYNISANGRKCIRYISAMIRDWKCFCPQSSDVPALRCQPSKLTTRDSFSSSSFSLQ